MSYENFKFRLVNYFTILVSFIFIGFVTSKKSGENSKEFFLSGRNMPWWILAYPW